MDLSGAHRLASVRTDGGFYGMNDWLKHGVGCISVAGLILMADCRRAAVPPDSTLDPEQNPVVKAGDADPASVQQPKEERTLSERVRLALTTPAAGAGGTITDQANVRNESVVPTVQDLEVTVTNRVVTVRGFVVDEQDKENVESIVRQVDGIKGVVNEVRVRR